MARLKKNTLVLLAAGAALLICAVLSLLIGAVRIPPTELWQSLTQRDSAAGQILLHVRLPRLFAAALAGAALAVSGVLIQTVLQNPLASPGIIGVNAGAGLGAALFLAFLPGAVLLLPVAAFAGALASVLAVCALARRVNASRITLVLSGVAISALFTAGVNTIAVTHTNIMGALRDFQNGGFAGISAGAVATAAPLILLGLLPALLFAGELDVLGLGEESAASLGLNVRFYRLFFLTLAAVLAGAAVSFAGLLGFVGLMVPHMARRLLSGGKNGQRRKAPPNAESENNDLSKTCRRSKNALAEFGGGKRTLIALSALMGAAFLLLCDTIARTVFAPHELPTGILIAYLGVPFFLWLLFRERRKRRD
ncbi:MAG: iron ABC transporter permease [Oscillospiraceae bacterium]|jgi:iron complex transport system permease protein|nr:iron ABC transporter permease [Oscillospiraceae bacterium]